MPCLVLGSRQLHDPLAQGFLFALSRALRPLASYVSHDLDADRLPLAKNQEVGTFGLDDLTLWEIRMTSRNSSSTDRSRAFLAFIVGAISC
jgi:hypothetical protein